MNQSCPRCQGQIELNEAHFGSLYTCPHCQGIYFISWEGNPEGSDLGSQHQQIGMLQDPPLATLNDMPVEIPVETTIEMPQLETPISSSASFEVTPLTEEVAVAPTAMNFEQALSSIQDFANSTKDVGLLSYSLWIGGIDLPSQIQVLKEVLEDSRLGLGTENWISQIKNGQLNIENMNPVKAAVVIQRLQFEGFDLRWKQNVG